VSFVAGQLPPVFVSAFIAVGVNRTVSQAVVQKAAVSPQTPASSHHSSIWTRQMVRPAGGELLNQTTASSDRRTTTRAENIRSTDGAADKRCEMTKGHEKLSGLVRSSEKWKWTEQLPGQLVHPSAHIHCSTWSHTLYQACAEAEETVEHQTYCILYKTPEP
jgi:hypothetical protein